jgi:hypothetical protein
VNNIEIYHIHEKKAQQNILKAFEQNNREKEGGVRKSKGGLD